MKTNKIFSALLVSLILLGDLAAQKPKPTRLAPGAGNLVVTFLNVRQGDSAVICTPTGKTYLIDTGPNEEIYNGDFDAGKDVIVPFLKSQNTKVIEGMVITHPHYDHYGGALSVMNIFKVHKLIDSGWPTKSPPYLDVLKKAEQEKMTYQIVKEGDKLDWDPYLKVDVLGPRPETYSGNPKKENPNNRSVIIKLVFKKIAFLFPGDAELEEENSLADQFGIKLKSHILKTPHHASKTSTTGKFLDAVKPEVAIISCGRRNRFSHPHASALERFKERGIKYFRTDQDGTIQVISDGKRYTIKVLGKEQKPSSTP